ncbi:uncharacterized protein B0P05DRAFT_354724 [Gilbertella persicaria]|uniref:uncharacterized protein n=1 Tax=Gilbertella persicaria TaxID=101096 RepID=UPI0022201FD6|nr:uncharacterized protein B0P05DRAFT_354724 [Gilbertella persicaria]KAI8088031.1 hypothetical protein B0P05DRAFT_354724 [Gilbertella persicaria]
MPPKETNDQYQHARQQSHGNDMSFDEFLSRYHDNSQLLDHILAAKTQEEKRKTAEELRQAEEARLQDKFIQYELNQHQDTPIGRNVDPFLDDLMGGHSQASTSSLFAVSLMDQHSQFSDHSSSLQAGINTSPSLPITTSEFQYMETISIASSSPSLDLISPTHFDVYHDNNSGMVMSCSPPDMDLPLFPSTLTTAPIVPSSRPIPRQNSDSSSASSKKTTPNSSPKPHSASTTSRKGAHRTLSYESVMNLGELNMNKNDNKNKMKAASPPNTQPLDHDKVMEALRAKLRRSTSPYQNPRPKPSPEPTPPPPNTYPTTGVLLLNLKNRRRKSSVTKRGSNNNNNGSGSA